PTTAAISPASGCGSMVVDRRSPSWSIDGPVVAPFTGNAGRTLPLDLVSVLLAIPRSRHQPFGAQPVLLDTLRGGLGQLRDKPDVAWNGVVGKSLLAEVEQLDRVDLVAWLWHDHDEHLFLGEL